MGLEATVRGLWERLGGGSCRGRKRGRSERTVSGPVGLGVSSGAGSIFAPFRGTGIANALPKPTAVNLRRFAETPVARRAINCIKDRIACMSWQVEVVPGCGAEGADDRQERAGALTRALRTPNESDSFRTAIEQILEDTLVGGFGAAEIELTGEADMPVRVIPGGRGVNPGESAMVA